MAAATYVPAKLTKSQVDGAGVVDFDSDTFLAVLVREGASRPSTSKTGVQFLSDVTGTNAEVSGGTYARQTLAGLTVAFDGANDNVDWSFSNITFLQDAASGPTDVFYGVIVKDGANDAARRVIAVLDLGRAPGVPISLRTGDLVLSAPTGGLIQWSKSP